MKWANSQILAGVREPYTGARRTAHNEVTRELDDGSEVVRHLDTDILTVSPCRRHFTICTGGDFRPSRQDHIRAALRFYGVEALYYHDYRQGLAVLRTRSGMFAPFRRCAIIMGRRPVQGIVTDANDQRRLAIDKTELSPWTT